MPRITKVLALFFLMALPAACAPSEEQIQTAIAETQGAWTSTFTATVKFTATLKPSSTKMPPTLTPFPKNTYILETGWCMLSVGDLSSDVDPKSHYLCNLDARQQIQLGQYEQVTATLNNLDGQIEVYCALFSLEEVFIMSDIDTTGSGQVICFP